MTCPVWEAWKTEMSVGNNRPGRPDALASEPRKRKLGI